MTSGNNVTTPQNRRKGKLVRTMSQANGTARIIDASVTQTTRLKVRSRIAKTRRRKSRLQTSEPASKVRTNR